MQPTLTNPSDNRPHFCQAICWKSILAGAVTASVVTLVLLALGSGIGLAMASPFAGDTETITSFTLKVGLWMIVMQWVSGAFGGYLAGRLRKRDHEIHVDEVYFRDTAHGFLTWSVATLITAVLLTSAATSLISGGAKAATVISAGAAAGTSKAIAENSSSTNELHGYYIDALFRGPSINNNAVGTDADGEATRILLTDLKNDSFPDEDKQYLAQMVAARTGVSSEEAAARVEETVSKLTEAKQEAIEVADKARKASSAFSIFTALSMVIGAFIAALTATLGGRHRELYFKK